MPNTSFATTLRSIGLPEREITVYLTLLELGDSPAALIAQKSGIKRTNTYDILEGLSEKGLVSYYDQGRIRHFIAEDPSSLEKMLKERLASLADILPDLRSVYNHSVSKPRVRFYDGREGLLSIYNEMEAADAFDALGSPGQMFEEFSEHFVAQGEKTVPKKTRIRELITPELGLPVYAKNYKKPLQEIRFLPAEMSLKTDMVLYGDKLVLFSYSPEVHAIVIEGSSVVESHRQMFEYMWRLTPEIA